MCKVHQLVSKTNTSTNYLCRLGNGVQTAMNYILENLSLCGYSKDGKQKSEYDLAHFSTNTLSFTLELYPS